jgi:hypothetical protein
VGTAFETLLLSSACGYGFEDDLAILSSEEKRKIYERALNDFYFYSTPSLPFRDDFMPDLADIGYASLTISPQFTDPDFIGIYNNKNVATRAVSCTIKGSPLLINLRLFLNLRLADYHHLPELSQAKEKLEKSEFPLYVQGVHLAEGADPEWNWSFMPPLDLPKPGEQS